MNILVTGGAGYVGSNLIERLLKEGHSVVSIDNYSTGTVDNHKTGCLYYNIDTWDLPSIREIIKEHDGDKKFDVVYHLGEYSRVHKSLEEFDKVWLYNIQGTKNILYLVKKMGARLIYTGSSTKFADGGKNRFKSPYALTKAHNSEIVKAFCDWNNIPVTLAYLYNVYGKNDIKTGPYSTVVGKFQWLAEHRQPLEVTRPGTQKRVFTHIDDTVEVLYRLLEEQLDEVHIGNKNNHITVLELAQKFASEYGVPILWREEESSNRNEVDLGVQFYPLEYKKIFVGVKK